MVKWSESFPFAKVWTWRPRSDSISSKCHPRPIRPSARFWTSENTNTRSRRRRNEARKSRRSIDIKEIKLRPNIDDNDYNIKMRNMRKFLTDGDKVKITLRSGAAKWRIKIWA